MVYGYCRVSTSRQAKDGNSLEAQESALRASGATEIYADSFTGTKMNRPQFKLLLSKLASGDTLVVTKLDRIARTAQEGYKTVLDLIDNGIIVHVLNVGVLDNSTTGKLILQIMLAFAEFERDMIVERTQEGKSIAKLNANYHEGRPRKYISAQRNHALELLNNHSYSQVSEMTGISISTLQRIRKTNY